uniref:Angiotensin-converting enzyme 2 n=1 Tax=Davidia involucrata TaxID=16924 RepID=A0A5B7B5V5_DAVIN
MYYNHHPFPCLHCHPHSYIRMVQHLIERCLLLHMNQDQCIKALAEHAGIWPVVTLTVWRELLKENRDFFQAYFHAISPRPRPFISGHIQKRPRVGRRKQYWK